MPQTLDQSIHLLLPKTELQALRRRAKTEKISVAELVRRAIKLVYSGVEPNQKKRVFAKLAQHHELKMNDWIEVKQELLRRYE